MASDLTIFTTYRGSSILLESKQAPKQAAAKLDLSCCSAAGAE